MKSYYEAHKTDETIVTERLRRVLAEVARLRPRRILDIGCGRGHLLALIRAAGIGEQLAGIDIAESSASQARERGFDAVTGDIQLGLAFPTDSFDLVIFGEVIEHVVDPDAALQAIAQVLAPGGHLIVTTPNLASWHNRLMLALGLQPIFTETSVHVNLGRRWEALGQFGPTQGHLKIFTLAALREILVANGFVCEKIQGAPFGVAAIRQLEGLIARWPSFASDLIVTARNSGSRTTDYPRVLERSR